MPLLQKLSSRPCAGEAHLWAVNIDDPPLPLDRLRRVLSEDERARSKRFRFAADERRSVVGRGCLRLVLGSQLELRAEALSFECSDDGKPRLTGSKAGEIGFNVSHSGDWVLIGVASAREVGVDVERIRPVPEYEHIAERYFAPAELTYIRAQPEADRLLSFFRCWTLKEAFVKAVGTGLGMRLASVEVSIGSDEPSLLRTPGGVEPGPGGWTIWGDALDPVHLAALAVEGSQVEVRSWYWTGSMGIREWCSGTPRAEG